MPNRRVQLWLDADDYRELDELFTRAPGRTTVSSFLREVMQGALPGIRALVEAAESGDRETTRAIVDGLAGQLFASVGPEVAALHQLLGEAPQKGVDP